MRILQVDWLYGEGCRALVRRSFMPWSKPFWVYTQHNYAWFREDTGKKLGVDGALKDRYRAAAWAAEQEARKARNTTQTSPEEGANQ